MLLTILGTYQNTFPPNFVSHSILLRKCSELEEKSDIWAEWLQEINWVNYDVGNDAESYLYIKKYKDEKFLPSKKRETALFLKGTHTVKKLP